MNIKGKNKTIITIFIGLTGILSSSVCHGLTKTYGYWQAGPNKFWKDNETNVWEARGNLFQQNTPSQNPDIFCALLGDGFRLPSFADYNAAHVGVKTTSGGDAHFSHYIDNDIKGKLREKIDIRYPTASFWNEWGQINSYNNEGWSALNYWVVETSNYYSTISRSNITNIGNVGAVCVDSWPCYNNANAAAACVIDLPEE